MTDLQRKAESMVADFMISSRIRGRKRAALLSIRRECQFSLGTGLESQDWKARHDALAELVIALVDAARPGSETA